MHQLLRMSHRTEVGGLVYVGDFGRRRHIEGSQVDAKVICFLMSMLIHIVDVYNLKDNIDLSCDQ